MNAKSRSIFTLGCLLLICLCGCATLPTPEEITHGPLSYLQPGKVSQTDLLLRYGSPTGHYNNGKVFTWRLGRDVFGKIVAATRIGILQKYDEDDDVDWGGTIYDLVVVFDDHNMLSRFKLIRVRQG